MVIEVYVVDKVWGFGFNKKVIRILVFEFVVFLRVGFEC